MIDKMKFTLFTFSSFLFLFIVRPTLAVSLSLSSSPGVSSIPTLAVNVFLDTENKKTTGVDLLASFDNKKLKLVSVQKGNLYATYTEPVIDNTNGKVSLSAVVAPETTYQGSGRFAQLVFEPLQNGEAEVMVTYKKGERNDSNVADTTGNDILTEVDNVTVQVSGNGSQMGFFQRLLDLLIFWD